MLLTHFLLQQMLQVSTTDICTCFQAFNCKFLTTLLSVYFLLLIIPIHPRYFFYVGISPPLTSLHHGSQTCSSSSHSMHNHCRWLYRSACV